MIYVLSGGASLNYKIIGGTSQPTSASENTIWVNTDTKITSHVFSATEPTNPVEGMVWFKTGATSVAPFNALKKNGVLVYPTTCQQYVNGSWAAKTAKTYQGNAWIDWIFFLYNNGNIIEEVTGGWVAVGKGLDSSETSKKAPTITYNADGMVIKHSGVGGGIAHIKNAIDLSEYSTLKIEGTFDASRSTNYWFVWNDLSSTYFNTNYAARLRISDITTGVGELDVSSLNGEYYIGFGAYNTSSTSATITINRISLLK